MRLVGVEFHRATSSISERSGGKSSSSPSPAAAAFLSSVYGTLAAAIGAQMRTPQGRAHALGFIATFSALAMTGKRPPGGLLGAWLIAELGGFAAAKAWQASRDLHTIAAAAASEETK